MAKFLKETKVFFSDYPVKDQYKALLSYKSSLIWSALYWILKLHILPILLCVIFYIYYPPHVMDGFATDIYSSCVWWLYIYGLIFVTILGINILWSASFNFNFESAYKVLMPVNRDINIYFSAILNLFFPFAWFAFAELLGFSSRYHPSFYSIFLLILAVNTASELVLRFVQHMIQHIFLYAD